MSLSIDWLLWLSIALGETILVARALSSDSRKQLPWFTTSLGSSAAARLTLIAAWAMFHDFTLYGRLSRAFSLITLLAIGAAVVEMWRKVFGPSMALPPWTRLRFWMMLSAAYPACVLITQLCRARNGNELARSLWTFELIITSVAASTMLLLVVYSRKLNITWRPKLQHVAMGFVISLSGGAIAAVTAGRLVPMLTAQRFGQIAYLAALAFWAHAIFMKEALPEKAGLEMVETFWRDFQETQTEMADVASVE